MFCKQLSIVIGNAQIVQRTIATYYVALIGDRFQATRLFQSIEKLLLNELIKKKKKKKQIYYINSIFISNHLLLAESFANSILYEEF